MSDNLRSVPVLAAAAAATAAAAWWWYESQVHLSPSRSGYILLDSRCSSRARFMRRALLHAAPVDNQRILRDIIVCCTACWLFRVCEHRNTGAFSWGPGMPVQHAPGAHAEPICRAKNLFGPILISTARWCINGGLSATGTHARIQRRGFGLSGEGGGSESVARTPAIEGSARRGRERGLGRAPAALWRLGRISLAAERLRGTVRLRRKRGASYLTHASCLAVAVPAQRLLRSPDS